MKLIDLVGKIAMYFNTALYLMIGFAVVAFVYNIIKYFILPSDSANRKEAGEYVMWSLIGFFVILSLWGMVNILISTFDLGTNSPGSWGSIKNLFPN